jgi:hypothetical protein
MHSEMDIDDHLSDKLRKKTKGYEELYSEGYLAKFTREGNYILQIRQESSEASPFSKGPTITIDHLSLALLSTQKFSQTSRIEGTYDKKPSLFS